MSAGMVARRARVVALGTDSITLRFDRTPACGGCRAAKACAGNAPDGELALPLRGARPPAVGDIVAVGVAGEAALRATALTHATPLAGFLVAMGLAALAGLPEGGIAAASFAGLAAGFALLRVLARRPAWQLEPVLLDPSAPDTPSTEGVSR